MSVFTLQANMARGELTPYLHARVDTDHYQAGLHTALNVIINRYSGVVRCPGTRYRGPTKNANKKSVFINFEFNRSQVYQIEAGDQYLRFWTPAGRIESPPGTPVEIASPWLEADLKYLKWRQSGDSIYIVCKGYQPRILKRMSETSWTISLYAPQDGPYLDPNVTNTTLTPSDYGSVVPQMTSNTTPSGTVSGFAGSASAWQVFDRDASSNAFSTAVDQVTYRQAGGAQKVVDAYYLTAISDGNNVIRTPTIWKLQGSNDGLSWTTLDTRQGETGWTSGETRFYEFINSTPFEYHRFIWTGTDGTGGNSSFAELGLHQAAFDQTPFNLTASATTGINGGAGFLTTDVGRAIRMLGSDGRWRWAEIVARISSTVVTIRLHNHAFPDLSPIINWALGAWSAFTGWPSGIAIYEDRMTFARTDTDPLGVWASVSADYDNFKKSTPQVDDDGIAVRLTGGKLNDISWLVEGRDILGGTAGSLRAIGRNNPNTAFSPSNVRQRAETLTPSSLADPVSIENVILFLDFYEQALYEAAYTYEIEGYLAREVSTLNEHLFAIGVSKIVFMTKPHKLCIGLRYDGKLIAFTYDRDQKVAGASLIDVGGIVEDIQVLPGDTGTDLWLSVQRTINGSVIRYVETLAEFWRSISTVQDVPIYSAASVVYDGAATNTVTGVTHLKNEVVGLWADGRDLGDVTVSNTGVVTLPGSVTASLIVIGKRMPWKVQTLRLAQIGNRDGSGLGRKVNIASAYIDLFESYGVYVRAVDVNDADAVLLQIDDPEADPYAPVELVTGMPSVRVEDSWRNNGVLVMQGDRMYPVTIRAVQLEVDGEP